MTIITRAAEFCSSPKFERVFDNFARDHADAFIDATEAKDGDVEHKHEYKELHDQYLKLFEEELSEFVESEGATIEEFFKECREIHDGQYTALFEEHNYAWFVNHLLACMDYKHFYGLMVNEARRLHHLEALHIHQSMEKRLYVWGSGGTGQLGLGTEDDYALPQRWENGHIQLESVTSGGCHSAGIGSDGRLFLWGSDDRGQLGHSTSKLEQNFVNVPTETVACIPRESKTKLIACGWWSTLAVVSSKCGDRQQGDRVFSWGSNDHHQLGRDQRTAVESSAQIVHLPPRLQVASIACGWKHSLLATAEGGVFSWGSGRHGQLGLGAEVLKTEVPQSVEALKGTAITNVFCGWEHSVFRSSSGEVFTCGNNRHGQLGFQQVSGSVASENPSERRKQVNALPIRVADPSDSSLGLRTVQVGCGWHFVMCLTDGGKLVTWGKGSHGQLGLGGFENVYEPNVVPFPLTIHEIACGSEHTMVVTSSGDLYTCGWGEHGNLGHGDKTNRVSLEKVDFFTNTSQKIISVAAGGAVSIAVTSIRRQ
ncbi:hypothetical protein PC120_g1121 [Phytophthora cactorum]|nr:hypothetical protein PC120_g1121 [Phytophthora cactorum]